jgi:predicted nucleic acid-binding protein
MNFVLDASMTLAWCFSDEATLASQSILEKAQDGVIYAPSIWPLEVGNILIGAEKKKRIKYADMMLFLHLLQKLQIEIDEETPYRSFSDILLLAHAEKLTTYDAAYLELAMRKGIPLATKDKALITAAKKLGIALL